MSEPWVGSAYGDKRLLLLGESTYSWLDQNGTVREPSVRHAIELVEDVIDNFPTNYFMNCVSRAITGADAPDQAQLGEAWSRVAFTNYVAETVGMGSRLRPTLEMWQDARQRFPNLLNRLNPANIIVLGKTMWSMMPNTDIWLTDDVQAYRREDGGMTVCWAINHPTAGTSWKRLRQVIQFARDRIVAL